MKRDPDRPDEVTAFLRRGDPAASQSMPPHQVAALRARIEETLARRPRPAPGLAGVALAGAAALSLAAALLLRARAPQAPVPPPAAPASAALATVDCQLQFETASGTRIVWVLSPDLNF